MPARPHRRTSPPSVGPWTRVVAAAVLFGAVGFAPPRGVGPAAAPGRLAHGAFVPVLRAPGSVADVATRLNWDHVNWVPGATSTPFAVGSRGVTVSVTSSGGWDSPIDDRDTYNSTGSNGDGEELVFDADANDTVTITLSFDAEVSDLTFSVHDVDRGDTVAIVGTDDGGSPSSMTLSAASGSPTFTYDSGAGTAAGDGDGSGSSSNAGTLNVVFVGPVRTLTVTMDSNSGSYDTDGALSDVSFQAPALAWNSAASCDPEDGTSGHVLVSGPNDKTVYRVRLSTGEATTLFTDASLTLGINSLAYDYVHQWVYYVDNASASSNRAVRRYDVATGTLSTAIADVNALGIATGNLGVGGGSGAFYAGSYYLGVEQGSDGQDETWRIDFDGAGAATGAFLVTSIFGDVASHDWGDAVAWGGILYDFDPSSQTPNEVHHLDLAAGTRSTFSVAGVSQSAASWDGKIWNVTSTIQRYDTASHALSGPAVALTGDWPGGSAHDATGCFIAPWPDAVDDGATTTTNTPVTVDVMANDSDPDGDPTRIAAVDPATAQGGTTAIDDNGTPGDTSDDTIVYTPPAGFSGTDSFTYRVTDDDEGADTATVTVVVQPVADLSLGIVVDNPSPAVGQQVTFTVTVANDGPSTSPDAQVAAFTVPLPAGVSFVSATPSQGAYDREIWDVGSLANGASATLDVTFTVTADGEYQLTAEVARSTPSDPDSTPYDGSTGEDDDDALVVTTAGGSGGGVAGLESNGAMAATLAQLLFDRRIRAAETGGTGRLKRFEFDPGSGDGSPVESPAEPSPWTGPLPQAVESSPAVMRAIIPRAGPEGSRGYETSPTDLLPVTNADDVVAVDYLREADARRLGVFFGTLTHSGVPYEHTKVICDRLKGAVLGSVRHARVMGRPFVLSRLEHPSGAVDYALSFVAYRVGDGFVVDSRFRLDEYAPPSGADEVINLQVWAVSRDYATGLAEEVVAALEGAGPVRYLVSDESPPALPGVYVRKGRYENGRVRLELYNASGAGSIRVTGGTIALTERSERIAFERTVRLGPADEDHVVAVDLETGPLFDASFFIETPDGGRDQMYVADGSWGYSFDGAGAAVREFGVEQDEGGRAAKDGAHAIERAVSIQGEVKTWAVLFRYLRANGRPLDLGAYRYVEFTASGDGQMRVYFEKESVRTSDHFGTVVKLTREPKAYRFWFDELRRPDGTGRLDASDLLLLSFYVIGDQGRTRPFALQVSDLRFGGGVGDPLATVPDAYELSQNWPNPFNPTTRIEFGLPQAGPVKLTVYDMLGRRVADLVDRWLDAGRQTVTLDASRLRSGAYVYRLQAGGRIISRTMTLVR